MRIPEIDTLLPPRIVVIGDVMLDQYLWGTCSRISPEAPVQVVDVKRESTRLGGAANVAGNLVALGARADIVGVVGEDPIRDELVHALRARGVRTSGLVSTSTRPTTVKRRVMAGAQQIVRVDHEVAATLPKQLADEVFERADQLMEGAESVVLSDYGKGVLTDELTRMLIRRCRERGMPVLVDPKGVDYRKYTGATLITPNRKEAAAAVGFQLVTEEDVRRAGRRLRERFDLQACLITLSEDGIALFEEGGETFLPTEAREVFDVTGAGDTVIASLAVSLAAQLSLLEACQFANAAAGLVVAKVGSATVTRAEVARAASRKHGAENKVVALETLLDEVAALRNAGKRIVFTNGCFDILHAGHVKFLDAAAALGDVLVVGLNDDASVRRLKGAGRPINSAGDRAMVLASLEKVAFVTTFAEDTPMRLIQSIQPDVLVKGGDYTVDQIVGAEIVRERGGLVSVLPFLEGRSTTATIARATEVAG